MSRPLGRGAGARVVLLTVVSDLHAGSEWFMSAALRRHVTRGYLAGARATAVAGDLLDGDYAEAHGRFEQSETGFTRQARALLRALPVLPGHRYFWITGNHDHTYHNRAGVDVGQSLSDMAAKRGDFAYCGDRAGRFEHEGVEVEMWHPGGGGGANSGPLHRRISGYARGREPDVLLVGHYHRYAHVFQRGVHGLMCPTFQHGGSSFGRSMATEQAEGGLVLSMVAGAHPGAGLQSLCPTYVTARPDARAVPAGLTLAGASENAARRPLVLSLHLQLRPVASRHVWGKLATEGPRHAIHGR